MAAQRKERSNAEARFAAAWRRAALDNPELPAPVRDYVFHFERGWQLDFAWPQLKVAVEIEGRGKGGAHGGHHSVSGARRDCEKHNEAQRLGWRLYRFVAMDAKELAPQWVEYIVECMFYG